MQTNGALPENVNPELRMCSRAGAFGVNDAVKSIFLLGFLESVPKVAWSFIGTEGNEENEGPLILCCLRFLL